MCTPSMPQPYRDILLKTAPGAAPGAASEKANAAVRGAKPKQKSRSKSESTKLTGPRGLMAPANVANKTLLGS